jgi:poly-gamma-glutamate synthesis protein (capsule biosynthesis protein)
VASLHWGVERQHEVTAEQMQLAEQLTASGAFDLIVGHHAHVVQPIMRLHGVPVVFGLGNFLSNMTEPETSDGVIVRVRAVRDPGAARWRTDIALTPTSVDLSTFAIREVAPEDPSWQRTISVMTSTGVGHPSR